VQTATASARSRTGPFPARRPRHRRTIAARCVQAPPAPTNGCHRHWTAESARQVCYMVEAVAAPASALGADSVEIAHGGTQSFRNRDGAVLVLVILHDRDQGAADRHARTVQRMDEACILLALGTEARLHTPRLEVAAHRA